MKICVFGLWHLGSVNSAATASLGFEVVGLDLNSKTIENLKLAKAPVFEPNLDTLIDEQIKAGRLSFTDSASQALKGADVLWVTIDTPVDDNDEADVEFVLDSVKKLFPFIEEQCVVLISSQVPVGFSARLQSEFTKIYPLRSLKVAYSPENLRLGKALEVFFNPGRVVVGTSDAVTRRLITPLIEKMSPKIEWMSTESAEVTKHAINSFLAMSVTFANELARICEKVGASSREVERGLKTETRIGPGAYVSPGAPFAGGTLARDIRFLLNLGATHQVATPIFNAVQQSNDLHKGWALSKIRENLKSISSSHIAVFGLTYKTGTSALRRSWTIEFCDEVLKLGAKLSVFYPQVLELPPHLASQGVLLNPKLPPKLECVVISTAVPQILSPSSELQTVLNDSLVVDPNGILLSKKIAHGNRYLTVGEPPSIKRP